MFLQLKLNWEMRRRRRKMEKKKKERLVTVVKVCLDLHKCRAKVIEKVKVPVAGEGREEREVWSMSGLAEKEVLLRCSNWDRLRMRRD